MLVFEIIQNDGLLCEQALSLFVFCLLSITFYVLHMNTCVCAHICTNAFASLACDVPVVVDNEIPTGWETPGRLTAHFKHCSLPFHSRETQRMKGQWEEE